MNTTAIYTTRKLEKVTNEIISKYNNKVNEYLGDWSATIFYVNHKKCWLVINKHTKYLLILPNVKKSDLKNISSIFKEAFYSLLACSGIKVDYKLVDKIVGEIELYETNNDQSTNASLNNNLLALNKWKSVFSDFESVPFVDLNNKLNSLPSKMLNWKTPKEKMEELIKDYTRKII